MGMGMGMDSSLGDGLGGVAVVPRATGTSTVSGANLQVCVYVCMDWLEMDAGLVEGAREIEADMM